MAIKAWGPLFAWLVLAAAGIIGLFVEHPEPNNRGQPTVAPCRDRPECKRITVTASNENDDKGKQESNWYDKPTDWLLALFTGILALYTRRLYQATAGLFKETAGLHNIADEQRVELSRSIAAAEKAADAATLQAKAAIGVELPIIVAQKFAIMSVPGFSWLAGTLPEHPMISVQFYNYGRSPAEMLGYRIVPKITNKLPDVPELVEIYYAAPGTMIDRSSFLAYTYIFEWSSDQMSKILAGEIRLWIYGSVAYKDFLSKRHDVGFCAMGLPGYNNLAFVYSSDTPSAYVYHKSE